jgi:MtfA peptidase
MRILRPTAFVWNLLIAVFVGLGVAVVSEAVSPGFWWVGLPVFLLVLGLALRRAFRRWRIARQPLGDQLRAWLTAHISLYSKLDASERRRFERDVAFLLDEWTYETVGNAELTTERRNAIAAGGALLLHGRPDWELPARHTVLLYPGRFDDDYLTGHRGDLDGMAHEQGPVIVTVDALDTDWAEPDNGHNVVLHEFAHLLEFRNMVVEGSAEEEGADGWDTLVEREMRRVRSRNSMLRSYAATNRMEFFAVAVENFFERPDAMESRHPELFRALRTFFNLDPRTGRLRASASKREG